MRFRIKWGRKDPVEEETEAAVKRNPVKESEDDAAEMYRDGITDLLRLKSKAQTSCGKPKNITSTLTLFCQNAREIVRIFDPTPDKTIYGNKNLLVEANIFLRKGGRIRFLHGPETTKLGELLQELEKDGLIQAEDKTMRTPNIETAFATMDDTGIRSAGKTGSYFCANDQENTIAFNRAFDRAWEAAG